MGVSVFTENLLTDLEVNRTSLSRITSYNVCYTKLLRSGMASGTEKVERSIEMRVEKGMISRLAMTIPTI